MSLKTNLNDIWQDPNKKTWVYIIFAALLTLIVVGYKAHVTWIPASAKYIAAEIPHEIYQSIGESTLESLDGEEFKPTTLDEQQQQQIQAQFSDIISKLNLNPDNYQLHFRDWVKGLNAFALMNGAIIVTDDLINTLNDPQQINAVLLHEIGHINHNHLMENTIRVSIFYVTLSLIFGDISVVSDLLIEASTMGVNFSFSRELELQADTYAAQSMLALYGTVEPAVKAFTALELAAQQKQDNSGGLNQWLSTHPPTDLRIEHIKKVAENHQKQANGENLSPFQWH